MIKISIQTKAWILGKAGFEKNLSEPEIKVATCSLSHPVHISEEVLVPSCHRKIRADLKSFEIFSI